jgi:hypothetical protein
MSSLPLKEYIEPSPQIPVTDQPMNLTSSSTVLPSTPSTPKVKPKSTTKTITIKKKESQ